MCLKFTEKHTIPASTPSQIIVKYPVTTPKTIKTMEPTRLEKEDVFFRVWTGMLSSPQIHVMAFLIDRIVRWNKPNEVIYIRQLVEGIKDRNGKSYSKGVCDSERTAKRIMAQLCKLGIISKTSAGMSNRITINFNWRAESMLKQSKKLHNSEEHPNERVTKLALDNETRGDKIGTRGDKNDTKGVTKMAHIKDSKRKRTIIRRTIPSPDGSELEIFPENSKDEISIETLSSCSLVDSGKSASVRLDGKGEVMNSGEVSIVWQKAISSAPWIETVDCKEFLMGKQAQALASHSKRYMQLYPTGNYAEYLTWVIHRWHGLMYGVFHWMKNPGPPTVPDPMFIIRHTGRIEDKWREREDFEKSLSFTPEAREVDRLVRSGMDPALAKKKVAIRNNMVVQSKLKQGPIPDPPEVIAARVALSRRKHVDLTLHRVKGDGYYDKPFELEL